MPHASSLAAPFTIPGEPLQVVTYWCPHAKTDLYALWNGDVPVLAANVYLRAVADLEPTTLRTKAYAMLPWFRFLRNNDRSFWDPTARTAGTLVALFKGSLDRLRKTGELTDTSAQKYMQAAYLVCKWWRQAHDPPLGHKQVEKARGMRDYTGIERESVPAAWRLRPRKNVPVPRGAEPPPRRKKSLSDAELRELWHYLSSACRPVRPAILREKPSPKWTTARRARYDRTRTRHDRAMVLYRRDMALFAILLVTGARVSEIPVLTTGDIETPTGKPDDLYLHFRIREHTQHLARLKSGPKHCFIGHEALAVQALRDWQAARHLALGRWTRAGHEAHDSLFTKDNGGPMTKQSIIWLFRKMAEHLDPKAEKQAEDDATGAVPPKRRRNRSVVHPHLMRHTLETLLKSDDVALEARRQQLGHTKADTTLAYGELRDPKYRDALRKHAVSTRLSDLPQ